MPTVHQNEREWRFMELEGRSVEQLKLEQIGGDIRQWRQIRAKPGPMPEGLWEEATSLARTLGVYRVSRALGLNYGALKERVAPTGQRGSRTRDAGPLPRKSRGSFVEVRGVPLLGGFSNEGTVVEVVASDGTRLTIRLKGGNPDITALVNAFRERR